MRYTLAFSGELKLVHAETEDEVQEHVLAAFDPDDLASQLQTLTRDAKTRIAKQEIVFFQGEQIVARATAETGGTLEFYQTLKAENLWTKF